MTDDMRTTVRRSKSGMQQPRLEKGHLYSIFRLQALHESERKPVLPVSAIQAPGLRAPFREDFPRHRGR